MFKPNVTRRTILSRTAAFFGTWFLGTKASAEALTPSATEGPFYPTKSMRFKDIDNDLVKVVGVVQEAGGQVISLSGQVLDSNNTPRAGVRVEIWQCDLNGHYMHTGDKSRDVYDTGFQGFGHDITGPDGSYSFRTIMPTVYPGRTPHIHVKVLDSKKELLTTQFYINDHPNNARDRIYRRLSDTQRSQVTMLFENTQDVPKTVMNIIV